MFAIAVNEKTLPKILQSDVLSVADAQDLTYWYNKNRYFIRGYVDPEGRPKGWTTLPMYVMIENFDIDLVKAQTDWDLIVRKTVAV